MKCRNRSSYVSKDPEKRLKQLANLKQGKEKLPLEELIKAEKKLKDLDIISFYEKHIYLPEKRKTLMKLVLIRLEEDGY